MRKTNRLLTWCESHSSLTETESAAASQHPPSSSLLQAGFSECQQHSLKMLLSHLRRLRDKYHDPINLEQQSAVSWRRFDLISAELSAAQ